MAQIALGAIRYNPVTGAFEARVDIDRKGKTYRYPCSVEGSLTMDDATVRHSLKSQALQMARRDGGLYAIK